MIRALYEMKGLAHETRVLLYAARKVFHRGSVPIKIRARFRSRLFLLKNRAAEVAGDLRGLTNLTTAQLIHTRREMGFVNGAIREVDRFLSTPATEEAPKHVAAPEDVSWLDAPAGVEVEIPPESPASVTEEPDSYDFLDALEIPPGEEEMPQITGPMTEGTAQCPVCGDPDPADRIPCPACGVRYHRECWEYFGGCAIYGCGAAVT